MHEQGQPPAHPGYAGGYGVPPATAPRRRRGGALWTVTASAVVFSMLAAAAWFGTPLLLPSPAIAALTFPGPARVEGLVELLDVPSQADEGRRGPDTVDDVSKVVDPIHVPEQSESLRNLGFRWTASVEWTGDDGETRGTLRLAQFRTVKGATEFHAKVLNARRAHRWADETSIVDVPGAVVFNEESRLQGEAVTALFGRGAVVGVVEVEHAARHAEGDVLALIARIAGLLPDGWWEWSEPPVVPMDLIEPVLPAPSGARNVSGVVEFGLLATADTYHEPTAGEEYLRRIGFRRGVTSEWQEGGVVTRVTLYLFADARGAEDFTANQHRGLNDNFPRAEQEPLPDLMVGSLQTYVDETTRVGAATFIQGKVAVEIYAFSPRAIDRARMVALAQQQAARLPQRVG